MAPFEVGAFRKASDWYVIDVGAQYISSIATISYGAVGAVGLCPDMFGSLRRRHAGLVTEHSRKGTSSVISASFESELPVASVVVGVRCG
ncbi:hypothetical protein ACFT1A_07130 [Rhodococcus sp. NPDC057135]|uniref:hypothetical protein n=1 Tax=Rhodococcus sp. NPDC057135 TaxID=3346028 RepID=UPI00363EABD6